MMIQNGTCFACWTAKATNTHSEWVILIAFPWQQWLQERSSVLCYMYNVSFVVFCTGMVAIWRLF